jgi:hypothetical protein
MAEIEKTEKERIKKKGKRRYLVIMIFDLTHMIGLKLLKTSGILDAY